MSRWHRAAWWLCATVTVLIIGATDLHAQYVTLSLRQARQLARQNSPALAAAQAAVDAEAGRVRQARAYPNPNLSYGYEETSGDGVSTNQNIAALHQRIEIGGQRGRRVAAARLRHETARARFELTMRELDFEVARAYIAVGAASRRAAIADSAARQFTQAVVVVAGRPQRRNVSGYEARRVKLEAARYAVLAAEAQLAARDANVRFYQLVGAMVADPELIALSATDYNVVLLGLPMDSVNVLAAASNLELRIAELEQRAAEADTRVTAQQKVPSPTLSAGYKNERTTSDDELKGFVAGISMPFPLWDRQKGAVAANRAESRRLAAERDSVRLRVERLLVTALDAVRSTALREAALRPHLGAEADAAINAAALAFAQGQISLIEWLDAVRAYQEAEATYANVLAEAFTQRAALERLLGVELIQ